MLLLRFIGFLLVIVVGGGTEVRVQERYLQPRHYNPHPLQSLLAAASPLGLLEYIPRDYSASTPSQLGRQGDSSPVQFPRVPEAARPTKSHTPGYITVPKDYAFAYAVKDRQSGDDFSHQQAQNGEGTKGEYRVKLPDGRTQIVSYTADSSGYKADVRYDGQPLSQPKYKENVDYNTNYEADTEAPSYQQERIVYKIPSPRYQTGQLLHKTAPTYHPVAYKTERPSYQPINELYKPSNPSYQVGSVVYQEDSERYQKQYPSLSSNSILQEPDYTDDPEVEYRQPIHLVQKYSHVVGGSPRPLNVLFSPSNVPQNQQFRAVPQTAAEYTSSDAPLYVATPTPTPGYYAPSVTSTAATPITEEQEDHPPQRKATDAVPYPPSSYYSVSTPAAPTKPRVRYFLVPNPTQYLYSDS